jgi:hypothetical protein
LQGTSHSLAPREQEKTKERKDEKAKNEWKKDERVIFVIFRKQVIVIDG